MERELGRLGERQCWLLAELWENGGGGGEEQMGRVAAGGPVLGTFGKANRKPLNSSHQSKEFKTPRDRPNLAHCNAQPLSGSTRRKGSLALMGWWIPQHGTWVHMPTPLPVVGRHIFMAAAVHD